jgi:hypothetical protein
MVDKLFHYYAERCDEIETAWHEYIRENDWGSGEDVIKIDDNMFWEFVEDFYEREHNSYVD